MTTIIVGAGMAGIAAATKLKDYVVIDPRDYIGGRLRTVREPFAPMETGAGWFHETKENPDQAVNPLIGIAKKHGIRTEFDDESVQVYSAKGPIDPSVLGPIASKWEQYRSSNKDLTIDEAADDFSKEFSSDKAIAEEFVRAQKLGLGITSSQASIKYPGLDGRDQVALDGYDKIFEVLLESIDRSKIHLNEQVKEIKVEGKNQVIVVTNKSTYNGVNVIVTAPYAILKAGDIKFTPPLPKDVLSAIELGTIGLLGKVYVEFPHKFWDEKADKILVTGEDPALVYNWAKAHHSDRNILSCLAITDTIKKAESATSSEEAWSAVKKFFDAVNISGKPTPAPTFLRATKWSVDPYSKGSFSSFPYGTDRKDAVQVFEKGADPIFFAGEHTSLVGATFLHGAYLSGVRAAKQASS